MRRHSWMSRGGWLCGVVAMLLLTSAAQADEPAQGRRVRVGPMELEVELDPVELSDYWIGLACQTLPDQMRKDMDLEEDEGILVLDVVDDSPAEKAGFKKDDVLVKAGDKRLAKVQDLIDVVDAAKDENEVAIKLIRNGEPLTLKVTPTKRPEELRLPRLRKSDDPRWPEGIKEFYEKFAPGKRFRFFHPGWILPRPFPFSLPGNMTIAITKEGDQPAKIKVTKDGEKWEVTEDELDELPEEVRQHVERMLGRPWRIPGGKVEVFDFVPEEWPTLPRIEVLPKVRPEAPLEKRLEEMKRELEQLRESIDELRKARPRSKAPKAEESGEKV